MDREKTARGTNFTCFHVGPMVEWTQYLLEPPEVPRPARGKLFLRNLLGSAGMEMSLNVVQPGKGMPFLHRHRENDEVCVIVGGQGQFLVDGECIDVTEGSVLRMGPAAAGLGETTRMRRCTSSASSTGPTVLSKAAPSMARRSKERLPGRTSGANDDGFPSTQNDSILRSFRLSPVWHRRVRPIGKAPWRSSNEQISFHD